MNKPIKRRKNATMKRTRTQTLLAAALFAFDAIGPGRVGVALWPAAIIHAALAGWCITCLRPVNPISTEPRRP